MRRSRWVMGLGLAAVLAGASVVSQSVRPAASSPEDPPTIGDISPRPKTVPQRQWEYKQTVPCGYSRGRGPAFEEDLNEAGRKGWELVSLEALSGGQVARDCYLATFKRETLH